MIKISSFGEADISLVDQHMGEWIDTLPNKEEVRNLILKSSTEIDSIRKIISNVASITTIFIFSNFPSEEYKTKLIDDFLSETPLSGSKYGVDALKYFIKKASENIPISFNFHSFSDKLLANI